MIPKVKTIENIIAKEAAATGKSARTKARAVRRDVKKVKDLAQMKGVPLSNIDQFSRKQPTHLTKVLSTSAVKQFESLGAAEYVESLLVPETGSARIPDLSMYPTVPIHIRGVYTPHLVVQADSGNLYSATVFTPNIIQGINDLGGISSLGALTWDSPLPINLYSSIQSNFVCYRVVSMAVRVINSSNYNIKAGICYTDLIGGSSVVGTGTTEQSIYARPGLLSGVTSSQTVNFGSFSQEFSEEVPRVSWLPLKMGNMEFIPTNGQWYENTSTSGAYPSSATSGPSLIALVDHQTTNDAVYQRVSFEYFYNIEAVPYYDLMPLFDAQSKVGNPAAVTECFLKNEKVFGETLNGTVQQAERILGKIREFSGTINQIGTVFQGAMSVGPGLSMGARDLLSMVQNKFHQFSRLTSLDKEGTALLKTIDEIIERLSVKQSDEKCAWSRKVNVFLRPIQNLDAEKPKMVLAPGSQDPSSSYDLVRISDSSPTIPPTSKAGGIKGTLLGSLGL